MSANIDDVKDFWENNPLFTGESEFEPGTLPFFEHHKDVYYKDVFADSFQRDKFLPKDQPTERVLDLGCGIGFWTIEIQEFAKFAEYHSADLTENALKITQKRLEAYGMKGELSQQNAEKMTFPDGYFGHVNCQGVIHHTPDTEATLKEIARVLKPGGTASISVYYKNALLRNWKYISVFGKLLSALGGGLKGRGRESIFSESDPNEITRLYDGNNNPLGKSYSKREICGMAEKYFNVEKTFLFFFPARALPFKLSGAMHRFFDRNMGFMIHLNLIKK